MKLFEPQVLIICCIILFPLVAAVAIVYVVRSTSPGRNANQAGSQPRFPAPGSVPAGWHPDPKGVHQYRYWDGMAWTASVSDNGQAGVDPM